MPATVAGQGGSGAGAVLGGVLERGTFANPETGYTIARIAPERGGGEPVTAVGPLLGTQVGEFLRLRGRWSSHPRYGRQARSARTPRGPAGWPRSPEPAGTRRWAGCAPGPAPAWRPGRLTRCGWR